MALPISHRCLPVFFVCALAIAHAPAADPAPASAPAAPAPAAPPATDIGIPGAEVTKKGDVITGLSFKDGAAVTEADGQKIRQMEGLKSVSFGLGFKEATLKTLAGMPAIENFGTNGMHVSDDGIATLATFPMLRSASFFHPGKAFTGTGFAALAKLPKFESLTVGGSSVFGDAGLAAIGTIVHLKELRCWHTAVTSEGIKALGALKELKSLTLGQHLDMKPPATLNDEAVAVIATLPALESISFQEARLSLAALKGLKAIPNLKRLTLDGIDIPEADVATLKQELPKTEIKWTAPTEGAKKRIDGVQGSS